MSRRPVPAPTRFDPSWLTRVALVWALAVVAARMITTDALREPWEAVPGAIAEPRHPGPASAVVFDLLAAVPALLVLARHAIDRSYMLRRRLSPLLLLLLAFWCVASAFWAADKFAAVITGLHVVAAGAVVWAMSQLVRSWSHLRLVAAVAGGLLLVLVVQSLDYRFVDVAMTKQYWNENKAKILAQHHWEPGSYDATMFEQKLLRGDLIGFFGSINTSAAVGVMLFAVCVGIGIFRFRAGDGPGWLGYSGVAVAALVWELIEVQSKTSAATPVLGLAVIAIWAAYGHRLRRYRGRVFLTGLGVVAAAALVVAGIGLKTGTLFAGHFSNSLDFRWKYWTAAAGVFRQHPLLGVGYDNFGPFYLAHRRPDAAEEIKDPHNLVVRFFTELGVVGGLLLMAWLARLGWELLRPADASPDSVDAPPTIREPMVIAGAATVLALIANTDFDYDLSAQSTLLLRSVIYGLAILFGAVAGSLLDPKSESIDPRPARWVYACMATGIGLFFVHNMIDFPWAETGALMVFAAIAGAAVGMTESLISSVSRSRAVPVAIAAAAVIAWLAVAGAIVFPVVAAEGMVASAETLVRSAPADPVKRVEPFAQAVALYRQAADMVPYNADYKFQLARAEVTAMEDLSGISDPTTRNAVVARYRSVSADIAEAIRADPTRINALLLEAENPPAGPGPAGEVTVRDFDAAVRLDPNDVGIRREYGQALDRLGMHDKAAEQYRAALRANDALPVGEPKRLPADQVAALQKLAG